MPLRAYCCRRLVKPLLKPVDAARLPMPHEQMDRSKWPTLRNILRDLFLAKSRTEWTDFFQDRDVCVSPVLDPEEVAGVCEANDGPIPQPAPRLSETPARPTQYNIDSSQSSPDQYCVRPGQHTVEILKEVVGLSDKQIQNLIRRKKIHSGTGRYLPAVLANKL